MPKAFIIAKTIVGADPGIREPDVGTGWRRQVPIGDLPGPWALFFVVGSGAQLTAIDNHTNCIAGLLVTSDGVNRFPELDQVVPVAFRNKANPWLTARGLPTIGASVTLLQLIRRVKAAWDYGDADLNDG